MLFSIHILQRQADASAMADGRFMPKYRQKNNLRHVIASEAKRLGEKIRTSGLLNPIQARYQTAPHPVNEGYYTTFRGQKQALLAKNLRDFAPANAKRRYRRFAPPPSRIQSLNCSTYARLYSARHCAALGLMPCRIANQPHNPPASLRFGLTLCSQF